MSRWYEVKNADDIDMSDDKKYVHILFDTDDNGNCYVEVPAELLTKLLTAQLRLALDEARKVILELTHQIDYDPMFLHAAAWMTKYPAPKEREQK